MILSFSPLGWFHTVISLLGIFAGLIVLRGLLTARRMPGWTAFFLITTILTNATGFFFPFYQLMPSHIIGAISLVILAVALFALYAKRLGGPWRWVYTVSAVTALYFNVFVLVVQLFRRVPALTAAAPTQSEPPFAVAQLIVLAIFVWLGVRAVKRFHPA